MCRFGILLLISFLHQLCQCAFPERNFYDFTKLPTTETTYNTLQQPSNFQPHKNSACLPPEGLASPKKNFFGGSDNKFDPNTAILNDGVPQNSGVPMYNNDYFQYAGEGLLPYNSYLLYPQTNDFGYSQYSGYSPYSGYFPYFGYPQNFGFLPNQNTGGYPSFSAQEPNINLQFPQFPQVSKANFGYLPDPLTVHLPNTRNQFSNKPDSQAKINPTYPPIQNTGYSTITAPTPIEANNKPQLSQIQINPGYYPTQNTGYPPLYNSQPFSTQFYRRTVDSMSDHSKESTSNDSSEEGNIQNDQSVPSMQNRRVSIESDSISGESDTRRTLQNLASTNDNALENNSRRVLTNVSTENTEGNLMETRRSQENNDTVASERILNDEASETSTPNQM